MLHVYWFTYYRQLKIFTKVGQRSRSRSLGQKFWYGWKALVTRNMHAKYESCKSYSTKVIAKVKVCATDRQTDTHTQTGQKLYAP